MQEDPESGAVLLAKAGESVQQASVQTSSRDKDATVPLRTGPNIQQPILADMKPDTEACASCSRPMIGIMSR